jgi:hypothetical protein
MENLKIVKGYIMATKKDYSENVKERAVSLFGILDTEIIGSGIVIDEATLYETSEKTEGFHFIEDTETIDALIELLQSKRRIVKEREDKEKKEKENATIAEKTAEAVKKAESMREGDYAVFTMGTGKGKMTFTRKVLKVTDKTFTVQFDADYPCKTSLASPIGKKYVKIGNLVSYFNREEYEKSLAESAKPESAENAEIDNAEIIEETGGNGFKSVFEGVELTA